MIGANHRANVEFASGVLEEHAWRFEGATRLRQSQNSALRLHTQHACVAGREPSQAPVRQPDDPPLISCFHAYIGG
jgi:hypothetical protein